MHRPLGPFVLTLLAVLGVLGTAGYFYSQQQDIPPGIAAPLLAAFLIEGACWVAMAFESVRERLSAARPEFWLIGAGALPYLVYSLPLGLFRLESLGAILALVAVESLWYRILPKHPLTDLGFLALLAAVLLAHWLAPLYLSPLAKPKVGILGDLMWRRTGVLAVLLLRGAPAAGFGFLPRARDWRIGSLAFLWFVPLGVGLTLFTGFARFHPRPGPWWKVSLIAAGTFIGMLWVVALVEEFFFRGLLQHWLTDWTRSATAGLAIASVLFGLVHLPFRPAPNWRFALLAAVAGLFYGWAYRKAGSIRAAMVAHALVNTMWRVLFA